MKNEIKIGFIVLACFSFIIGVSALIANNTLANDWLVVTNINVTGDYFWRSNNLTAAIDGFSVTPVNEWGLVYGTTGDWFNYTVLSGATPVYIGVQMHPLNLTASGVLLIPEVYDKDGTHWQLGLYWVNGTQYNQGDVLVMYYAHIDWNNTDGLTFIRDNAWEPL
jgi:hypothetical protein